MIAKLIVWDDDRDRALARMQQALADYRVVGVNNNIEVLSRLVASPAFASADLDTGLIERRRTICSRRRAAAGRMCSAAALSELLAVAHAEAGCGAPAPIRPRPGMRATAGG